MKSIKFTFISIIFIFYSSGLAFTSCQWQCYYNNNNNVIKGSKKLITQEISITDYDKIELIGNVILNYKQSDSSPCLQLTIDDNLLDYIDVYVKNKTLIVTPKRDKKKHNNYNIQPTTYIINTNSTGLTNVNNISGTINFISDINADKLICAIVGNGNIASTTFMTAKQLEVKVTGSGNASFNGDINICNVSIAGSGNAFFNGKSDMCKVSVSGSGGVSLKGDINTCNVSIAGSGESFFNGKSDTCKVSVSGSGGVSLKGDINTCNVSITGSGEIGSYNCSVKDLSCRISGSGNVELHVENTISCSIAGSGSLKYTGNPLITRQSISGSGKIIQQ
ncbi:MAG: DUF2807 domain-containing protein [Bacteroidales bacterium]|jgi:hypothetical protein|nr:DUF2807 domain-containing protein [Bacteroidales bacterium]